jgi:Ser/Thr protein kinase RdoA (MazF antagonist)
VEQLARVLASKAGLIRGYQSENPLAAATTEAAELAKSLTPSTAYYWPQNVYLLENIYYIEGGSISTEISLSLCFW